MKMVLRKKTENQKNKSILLVLLLCGIGAALYVGQARWVTSFRNDEFQSVSAAWNLLHGNGFVKTEYVGDTPKPYWRGWPATVLLALWMREFGTSELALRSLSAVYGVLFIGSVYYMSKRAFHRTGYSVLVCMMSLAERVMTKYFGTVRMYSLELLMGVWLYYVMYRALTRHNPFWGKKGETAAGWKSLLDFHWGYAAAALALLFLSYWNHVNSVIPVGGCVLYVFYQALKRKEARYRYLAGAMTGAMCVIAGALICYVRLGGVSTSQKLASVFATFTYYISGFHPQLDYVQYIGSVSGSRIISVLALGVIFVCAVHQKELDDRITYLLFLTGFSLIVFCFFSAGRYAFAKRYILICVPFAIAVYAYAYVCLAQYRRVAAGAIFIGMMLVSGILAAGNFKRLYTETNADNTDFTAAYSTVSEFYDLEKDTVPVVGQMTRAWYWDKVVPSYESAVLERTNSFDSWRAFALLHPQGIVTCENIKLLFLSQDVPRILLNWTDRLSGLGVDDTGVNVSGYCFVQGIRCGEQTDGIQIERQKETLAVRIGEQVLSSLEGTQNPTVLFLKVNFTMEDGQTVSRCCQVMLPADLDSAADAEDLKDDSEDVGSIEFKISEEDFRGLAMEQVQSVSVQPQIGVYNEAADGCGYVTEYELDGNGQEIRCICTGREPDSELTELLSVAED